MKKYCLAIICVLLSSCFGPAKFDASSESAIKESTQKIANGLPEEKQEDFQSALMYFSLGGQRGVQAMLGAALAGNSNETATEAMLAVNLQTIDGLTGEEIIEKHKERVEKDRIRREKEEAEQAKVNALKKEAQGFLESNKYEEALAKYRTMSEISSGVKAAEVGIAETTKAMEKFTEKMNYLDKVRITEFLAKRIDTYSEKNVPAVRISLKNVGDRSLDEVEVVVYFQDKDGNTIFEEDYHPVLVTQYSFGDDNKPLKPGYVKEMEKGKYYTLDSALSEWQEGKAIAKVVDIRFTE